MQKSMGLIENQVKWRIDKTMQKGNLILQKTCGENIKKKMQKKGLKERQMKKILVLWKNAQNRIDW